MKIDRKHVTDSFRDYTSRYNAKDPKILLKIQHTYRVASLCERIAEEVTDTIVDPELAWLSGMLHDIGRFEQVRRYHTFVDSLSVDHAQFGADLLFGKDLKPEVESLHGKDLLPGDEPVIGKNMMPEGESLHGKVMLPGDESSVEKDLLSGTKLLEKFVPAYEKCLSSEERSLLELCIRSHSAFRIPEGLTEKEQAYCNILRDADKIDIFRVNCDTPLEDIYNATTQELKQSEVSREVKECFLNRTAVLRSLKKTPIDYLAGHICLYFELVYPISRSLAWQQGYLQKMLDFESENQDTREWFAYMREHIRDM